MKYIKKIIMIWILLVCCLCIRNDANAASNQFEGLGSKEEPYRIENYEDLCRFRDNVNQGNQYDDTFFIQTSDIDLKNKEWVPIGIRGKHFNGIYNADGHSIKNLMIQNKTKEIAYGFFSSVGGTIANLKVESGYVKGDLSGGIAGASSQEGACIINCYSNVNVKGKESGGIAGNFKDGYIVGCINTGQVKGDDACAIVGYSSTVKVYGCYSTTNNRLLPKKVVSTTSDKIREVKLTRESFVKHLNVLSGLSEYLFKNYAKVQTKQWKVEQNTLVYSDDTTWSVIWGFINYNLLMVLLLLYILYFAIKRLRNKEKDFWAFFRKDIIANLIIFGILSLFMDTALFTRTVLDLKLGNSMFIILSNLIFVFCLIQWILHFKWKKIPHFARHIPFLLLVILCVLIEVTQFDIVPKYDASLYYGSFAEGAKQFNMGFISFLGNFVCWKWMHGLALLLGPIEFLMPGSIYSIHVTNIFISVITLFLLYDIQRSMFIKKTPLVSAVSCAYFVFCPYSIGILSYLCMDVHLIFFAIWLMYAIYKKNPLLISFCGFLLIYTKITGLVFYVIFLAVMVLYELSDIEEYGFFKSFQIWFNPAKVFAYAIPVISYMIFFVLGDYLTIQSFFGTYVSDSTIKLKTGIGMLNILFQSFIFGFRWLIPVLVLIIGISAIRRAKKVSILTQEGTRIMTGLVVSSVFIFILFCIYNGDAECPRYTAIFNVLFTFLFAFVLACIRKKKVLQGIVSTCVVLLMVIQTFYSIDPFVLVLTEPIYTGKTYLYKHALPNDPRESMALRAEEEGKESEGDLYVHNMQYSYEDDLIEQMLTAIPPKNERFYVLDTLEYELHVSGSYYRQYKIYWDSKKHRRTYDDSNKDTEYVNVSTVTTNHLTSDQFKYFVSSNDHVYLIVPARIKEKKALDAIQKCDYDITNEYKFENLYGYITVYELTSTKEFEY